MQRAMTVLVVIGLLILRSFDSHVSSPVPPSQHRHVHQSTVICAVQYNSMHRLCRHPLTNSPALRVLSSIELTMHNVPTTMLSAIRERHIGD